LEALNAIWHHFPVLIISDGRLMLSNIALDSIQKINKPTKELHVGNWILFNERLKVGEIL
jgi:hypothetical protein